MLADSDLRGVVGACITPVTPDFEIDVQRLKSHMEFVLAGGCSFVSEFGTTGEGASFSTRQKAAALRALAGAGMDMKRHIPGVVASAVDEAGDMLAAIAEVGARAALVIPPYYYTPSSNEAVADFYEAMIKRAGSPDIEIVLYNFPHFSGVKFDVPLVEVMLERFGKRIIGIKDSTGNLADGLKLIEAFPQLSIFTGDDRILPDMVAAGGAGMIGGMTNPYPADTVRLYIGPLTDQLRARAKARIEAVDAYGGTPVLKGLVAEMCNDDAFRLTLPPLSPASADIMEKVHAAAGEEQVAG
ncbi:dihydrodipicolinate synthase family protein [Martelella radicis]|uniref:4-hydroxy-tetrahydrodipicolinate synthase n=1 Tax=Martelella radicis TaxID=1397476 RepID=A0A7W6KNF3_9HYPH|nr:dihydrodipicolinate synthase family protein [Martelella radicis]MBB4124380.1 4-hydroxy-tetrahydrodipicolinate synthase [Martelella radicis]